MSQTQSPLKENSPLKSEVVTLFSGIFALMVSIVGILLITLIPADTDLTKYRGVLLPQVIGRCSPEPYEMAQYALFIVIYPVAFMIFYRLFSSCRCGRREKAVYYYNLLNLLSVVSMIALEIVLYLMIYDEFYEELNPLHGEELVVSVGVAYVLALLLKTAQKMDAKKQKRVFIFIAFITVGIYLVPALCVDYFHLQTQYHQHHFYAWWYPVYKVLSGKTPGVDFENIYGLYPYFVAPVLRLFGGATNRALSLYLALCQLTVAAGYFCVAYAFVRNKVFGVLAAFSASVYGPLHLIGGGLYAQFYPTRTLFIAICFIAISIYHICTNTKIKTLLNILMPFVLGLGIAWNIESGMIALIVWAAYHIYLIAQEYKLLSLPVLKETAFYIISSVASLVIFFAFAELVTYVRCGELLGKDALLFGIQVFAGTGFFMIKLLPGIWIGFAAIYLAALSLSIVRLVKTGVYNYDNTTASGLFTVSLAAIGAFSYFMGRSYQTNVLSFLPYCILLAPMLTECYADKEKHFAHHSASESVNSRNIMKLKRALCIYVVAVGLVASLMNIAYSLTEPYRYSFYGNNQSVELFDDTAAIVQRWSDSRNEGKLPNMLLYFSAYYAAVLDKPATEDVCEQIDWFYLENAHSYIDFVLKHRDESFVIDQSALKVLKKNFPDDWKAVEQNFALDETEDFIAMYYVKSHLYFYKPVN